MRFYLRFVTFAVMFSAGPAPVLAADDLLAQGKQLYQNGNYQKAEQCLGAQIKQHPKDAAAHYILGNVFVALKRNSDAKKEYQTAASLDPHGSVGQYCKVALSNLANHAYDKAAPAATPSQSAAENDPVSRLLRETSGLEKESVPVRHQISPDHNDQQQRLISEREAKIAEIRGDAERRVDQVRSEMQAKIGENGHALRARGRYYYDPADANDEIKKEYQPQIDAIKDDAQKRIQAVKELYARKLSH